MLTGMSDYVDWTAGVLLCSTPCVLHYASVVALGESLAKSQMELRWSELQLI